MNNGKNEIGHKSWRVIAAILVDRKTHFKIFVYRRFEIEILGIVARRTILPLEAQAGRKAGRQAGRQAGRRIGWEG